MASVILVYIISFVIIRIKEKSTIVVPKEVIEQEVKDMTNLTSRLRVQDLHVYISFSVLKHKLAGCYNCVGSSSISIFGAINLYIFHTVNLQMECLCQLKLRKRLERTKNL